METVKLVAQIVIALGILNVWLLRSRKATAFRGGDATNMREEFAVYGLPPWFMVLIGTFKVVLALLLLVGIWRPELVQPAAFTLGALMLGAVTMHIRVKDSLKKTLPSLCVLGLCLLVAFA